MSALTYPVAGDDLKAVCFEVLCSMLLRRLVEFDAVTDGDTRYESLLTSDGLGEKGKGKRMNERGREKERERERVKQAERE